MTHANVSADAPVGINAKAIADALGGIPALATACRVPYRLAYGYVDRDSIPAVHDVDVVSALKQAGSSISFEDIAKWRASSKAPDNKYHAPQAASKMSDNTCGEQDTNPAAPGVAAE